MKHMTSLGKCRNHSMGIQRSICPMAFCYAAIPRETIEAQDGVTKL